MLYKGQSKFGYKNITDHFKVSEIRCHDLRVKEYLIYSEVLEILEDLRKIVNKPIYITSAYRSKSYNNKLKGSSKRSQHIKGRAVDFHIKGLNSQQIYDIIKKQGWLGTRIKGIGLYNTFVHIDIRLNPNKRGFSYWDMRK